MKIILGLLLLVFIQHIKSQDIVVPTNQLLEFLIVTHEPISTITNHSIYKNSFIKLDNEHLIGYKQFIVKNKKGLFLLVDGTGRVYRVTKKDKTRIIFKRIDSTHFYGYNGNSTFFSNNDTLYSFGGDGFWRINGQLRYYSEQNHEWNIEQINKEIPTTNFLYYQDPKDRSILYLQSPYIDQATNTRHDNYIVTKLNLIVKKNKELGKLNKHLSTLFDKNPYYSFINIPSLNGTIIIWNRYEKYLIKYDTNEAFRLVNKKIIDMFSGVSNDINILNTFSIKDTVYYTKSNDTTYKLYSFPISMKDFVKEPYPLYEPFEDEKKSLYFYIGGLCMLLIGGSVFFVKKRKQKTTSINTEPSLAVSKKIEDNGIDFNPLELELIIKMIEQSARGNHFSVEDINTSLGLNRKTLEIQKKIRTETINRINHKFKIKYNLSIDLIERIRSEEDRRYYKYMISGENGKIVLS